MKKKLYQIKSKYWRVYLTYFIREFQYILLLNYLLHFIVTNIFVAIWIFIHSCYKYIVWSQLVFLLKYWLKKCVAEFSPRQTLNVQRVTNHCPPTEQFIVWPPYSVQLNDENCSMNGLCSVEFSQWTFAVWGRAHTDRDKFFLSGLFTLKRMNPK